MKEVYSLGCQKVWTTKDKIMHIKDIILTAAAVPLALVGVVVESTRWKIDAIYNVYEYYYFGICSLDSWQNQ